MMPWLQPLSEIVKMLAMVIGGLWVAWTFHKLQKVKAAEVDNNKKLAETERLNIERQHLLTQMLRQQPQLSIRLDVNETDPVPHLSRSLLCVTVTVKNEGDQNLSIALDNSALTMARIAFSGDGRQRIEQVHRFGASYFTVDSDEPELFKFRIIRAGQSRQMALALLPAEPGGYVLQFHAVYQREPFDTEDAKVPRFPINAVEQTFFVATGKATSAALAAPSCGGSATGGPAVSA
jgi:hypothetical protein